MGTAGWIISILVFLVGIASGFIKYYYELAKERAKVIALREHELKQEQLKQQEIDLSNKLVLHRLGVKFIQNESNVIVYIAVVTDTFIFYQFFSPIRSNFSTVKMLFSVGTSGVRLTGLNCSLDKNDIAIIREFWHQHKHLKIWVPTITREHYKQVTEDTVFDDFLTASNTLSKYDTGETSQKISGDNPVSKKAG